MVRIFIQDFFYIILVFLDALRAPNYSLEELLNKSCKMPTGLHKHHFYVYRTDFAMKRGQNARAITSLNAFKIAGNPLMLRILTEVFRKSNFRLYGVLKDGQSSMLLRRTKILLHSFTLLYILTH